MDLKTTDSNRRQFIKGMAMGAGTLALGSSLINPLEVMGQSIEASLGKASMEFRWGMASFANVFNSVNFYKSLVNSGGREKLLDFNKKQSFAGGARQKGIVDQLGLTGNDPKSAAEMIALLLTIYNGPKSKFEITGASANKANLKCIECPI